MINNLYIAKSFNTDLKWRFEKNLNTIPIYAQVHKITLNPEKIDLALVPSQMQLKLMKTFAIIPYEKLMRGGLGRESLWSKQIKQLSGWHKRYQYIVTFLFQRNKCNF